jgi:hypothetical protein
MLKHVNRRDDILSQWLMRLTSTKHVNIVTVTSANKTGRVASAMVHSNESYRPELIVSE